MATRTEIKKKIYNTRGRIQKRMNEIIIAADKDGKRALTAEEDAEWDKLLADDQKEQKSLQRYESMWAIERDLGKEERHGVSKNKFPASAAGSLPDDDDQQRSDDLDPEKREKMVRDAFNGWSRCGGDVGPTQCQRHAARQLRRSCGQKRWDSPILGNEEFQEYQARAQGLHPNRLKRDLTISTGSSGQYMIPQGFISNLELALLYFGPMLRVSDVWRTSSGNPIPWPTMNDTGNIGEMLAESASVGSSVDPTFGQKLFGAYKMSSKVIKYPYELTEDSSFNLGAVLPTALGTRLGRIINKYCTTGTGTNEPQGIVTGSSLGKTTASATAVVYSELIDLIHSVDIAYREQPGVGWLLHDLIIAALRKLVDGQSRPLWQSGLQDGVPDRLLGYGVNTNNDMDSALTTGKKIAVFGHLPSFKIRVVNQIRMRRLTELYAANDQEAFVGFLRIDSKVMNAGTNPIKYLAMA
ncbi:MAG: phage major capsid protein [Planctomycetota bacterium]